MYQFCVVVIFVVMFLFILCEFVDVGIIVVLCLCVVYKLFLLLVVVIGLLLLVMGVLIVCNLCSGFVGYVNVLDLLWFDLLVQVLGQCEDVGYGFDGLCDCQVWDVLLYEMFDYWFLYVVLVEVELFVLF